MAGIQEFTKSEQQTVAGSITPTSDGKHSDGKRQPITESINSMFADLSAASAATHAANMAAVRDAVVNANARVERAYATAEGAIRGTVRPAECHLQHYIPTVHQDHTTKIIIKKGHDETARLRALEVDVQHVSDTVGKDFRYLGKKVRELTTVNESVILDMRGLEQQIHQRDVQIAQLSMQTQYLTAQLANTQRLVTEAKSMLIEMSQRVERSDTQLATLTSAVLKMHSSVAAKE